MSLAIHAWFLAAGLVRRLRVVSVRIRISGIFRISLRPTCAFCHNRKFRKTNRDERLANQRRDCRILKIL